VSGELQRRGVAGDRSAVAVDADLLAGAGRDWADLVAGKWLSPFGEQLAEGEGDVFPGFDVDDACGVVGVQRGDQMGTVTTTPRTITSRCAWCWTSSISSPSIGRPALAAAAEGSAGNGQARGTPVGLVLAAGVGAPGLTDVEASER
jgi:hypothetical protein